MVRPFALPEAVTAVPAAAIALTCGAVSLPHARAEAERLGPVLAFLAAVLVLARLCADEGLFRACGAWMARRAGGSPRRLLAAVFGVTAGVTAVLSLDATVVLLTPVVLETARRVRIRPAPHVYACAHLSNTASLLLPVSNLTNLLAMSASGLSFGRFTALMALPWVVAVGAEYVVMRRFFEADLDAAQAPGEPEPAPAVPVFALVVVAGTLVGCAVASLAGIAPAWAAAAGALVLAVRALVRRTTPPRAIVLSAAPQFLAFVVSLAVVVRAVTDNGLAAGLRHLMPGQGTTLPGLFALTALAALLANTINNLPAVLALLPLAAPLGPGAVLAVLLGVNIGPNLTYAGSLATLLWRRVVDDHEGQGTVRLGQFTRLGLLTVPAALGLAVPALWAALQLVGT